METNIYDMIQDKAAYLKLSISSQEIAQFCVDKSMNENQTKAISEFMEYLKEKRHHNLVEML